MIEWKTKEELLEMYPRKWKSMDWKLELPPEANRTKRRHGV